MEDLSFTFSSFSLNLCLLEWVQSWVFEFPIGVRHRIMYNGRLYNKRFVVQDGHSIFFEFELTYTHHWVDTYLCLNRNDFVTTGLLTYTGLPNLSPTPDSKGDIDGLELWQRDDTLSCRPPPNNNSILLELAAYFTHGTTWTLCYDTGFGNSSPTYRDCPVVPMSYSPSSTHSLIVTASGGRFQQRGL